MKDKEANRVLDAWFLEELVSGGEIETKSSKWITKDWEQKIRDAHEDEESRKKDTGSLVYLGRYRKQDLRDQLQEYCADIDIAKNEDDSKCFSVAVFVDDAWNFEKIFIPYSSYLLLCLKEHSHFKYKMYKDFLDQTNQIIKEALSDQSSDIIENLKTINDKINIRFNLPNIEGPLLGILSFSEEPVMLNSFYAKDIEKIINNKNDDAMLLRYIKGINKHIDIDKNWSFIEKLLKVDNLPDGRWPSQNEHFQSLMQQVAINIIRDKASDKSDLRTINGPPGTGKTTLLKDIFDDMAVEQAKAMVRLNDPKDGFIKSESVSLSFNNKNYDYNSYKLIPSLSGYGIVVSSNNNSAVSNISKDFPNKSEIKETSNSEKNNYLNSLNEINYFSELENRILKRTDSWGAFAVPMGKSENQDMVFNGMGPRLQYLRQDIEKASSNDSWDNARKYFKETLSKVEKIKSELKNNIELINEFDRESIKPLQEQLIKLNIDEKNEDLQDLKQRIIDEKSALEFLPQKRFLIFWKRDTPEIKDQKEIVSKLFKQKSYLESDLSKSKKLKKEIDEKIDTYHLQEKKISPIKEELKKNKTYIPNDQYWQNDNDKVQLQLPNNSLKLQKVRSELFIAAIRLRKVFIANREKEIINSLTIFKERDQLIMKEDIGNDVLINSFQIMQLLFPVISTTLASVQSMFKYFGKNTLDNVFVDEAGQATPGSMVGLLWRAKKLVALGDPAQIEPVVTTDRIMLKIIANIKSANDKYLLPELSAQQLADNGSVYGTVNKVGDDEGDGIRIGIPLWVHRRCASPMFEISNSISYGNRMVQGVKRNKENVSSKWIDSKGKTTEGQFVKDNVEKLSQSIHLQLQNTKNIKDIFIISPFVAVVKGIKVELKKDLSDLNIPKEWFKLNIGTVHTFQGKEADIVYFVIGTDKDSDGAANWAFQKPNLLNVAVTRAKKQLIVIGDRKRLLSKSFICKADELLN